MKHFVIEGRSLCSPVMGGIQRYKHEIINHLDRIMTDDEPFEVHVCYPEDLTIMLSAKRHIKLVPTNRQGKRFLLQVIPEYAKAHRAAYVDLGIGWCLRRGGTIVPTRCAPSGGEV